MVCDPQSFQRQPINIKRNFEFSHYVHKYINERLDTFKYVRSKMHIVPKYRGYKMLYQ